MSLSMEKSHLLLEDSVEKEGAFSQKKNEHNEERSQVVGCLAGEDMDRNLILYIGYFADQSCQFARKFCQE